MFGPIEVLIIKATPEMIHNWGWFLAFGILLLLLGVAAIVRVGAGGLVGEEGAR